MINQRAFLKGDPGWNIVVGSCHCNFRVLHYDTGLFTCALAHHVECSRANCPIKIRKTKMLPGEYEEWKKTHTIYFDAENDPPQEQCIVCHQQKVEKPVQVCGRCWRIMFSKEAKR